ncbi:MAG: PilZ domain-containing protein [Isosphaeraceae bacterium]
MGKLVPRVHDRERVLREVRFRILPSGPRRVGHTLDLSPSGVRIFTDPSLRVGDAVELVWNEHDPRATASGRVVHVRVDFDGSWSGLQFLVPLSLPTFEAIKQSPVRA